MIPASYTYLSVDIACILFPLLFSFHPRLRFYRQWRYFLMPCILTAVFFLLWDSLFTSMGVWRFNPAFIMGIYLGNMPLEELLFFICIPYACVFSYYCFSLLLPQQARLYAGSRIFFAALVPLLVLVALLQLQQLYTSVTFLLLAAVLTFLLYRRSSYLGVFALTYLFILLPFMLSNGVLTGSFAGRMVVIYNNDYNLGLRLLTIPVEDIFYGMLLLLLNVYGFERNRSNAAR